MNDFENKTLKQLQQGAQALEKPDFAALAQAVLEQAQEPKHKKAEVRTMNKRRISMVVAAALLLVLTGVGVWNHVRTNGTGPYKAVYQALNDYQKSDRNRSFTTMEGNATDLGMVEEATNGRAEASTSDTAPADSDSTTGAAGDYGETNVQVQGVDEADIVKNDGVNLYILSGDPYYTGTNTVSIVSIADMQLLSQVHIQEDEMSQVEDMYVSGSRLVLIGSTKSLQENTNEYWQGWDTKVMIYEIAEDSSMEWQRSFTQEGGYVSSRMIDRNLYLVSNKQIYLNRSVYESEMESIVPHTRDSQNGEINSILPAECIVIAQEPESQFTVVSALSIYEDAPADTQSILSASGSTVYCSLDNLYLVSYTGLSNTEILKFKLSGATAEFVAKTEIDGWVKDQFALDEGGGHLRVAVTGRSDDYNYLYIFDENLQQVGKTEGLAQGETIRSVRYIGDMAYMVTFRQTDPLFAIDVSDPANPKVLGELKIPGFSTYMHPMDENTLIGIGYAASDTGATYGMKISLFDVSDPMNPTEISKLELVGACQSSALNDHKAVTWIQEDGLLLMPFTAYNEITAGNQTLPISGRAYGLAVSVSKETGIRIKGILLDGREMADYYAEWPRSIQRITYVGDTLYTVSGVSVIAADRYTLAQKDQLDFLEESGFATKNTITSNGEIEPYEDVLSSSGDIQPYASMTPSSGDMEPYNPPAGEIEPFTNYVE